MSSSGILSGVVVYVVKWRADGDLSFLASLTRKLESLGARIVSRIAGSQVTHIIFQQKAMPTDEERAREVDKLREIYEKIEKV